MRAILRATDGPSAGTTIVVRQGQIVQVGRTAWADYSIPQDRAMADLHFAVIYDRCGCRVRDLSGTEGTWVNGARIPEGTLKTGDLLTAGETNFEVWVEGESAPLPAEAAAAGSPAVGSSAAQIDALPRAADFAQSVELSEEALLLLKPDHAPGQFLQMLRDQELYPDAIRFLAIWLPKPIAVAWACQCVRHVFGEAMSPGEQAALAAAETWAAEPQESHRRAAAEAASAIRNRGPQAFVALAAFWSEGSLASASLPEVPPAPGLTAQGVTAALLMAAPYGLPTSIKKRFQLFLELGTARTTTEGVS